MSTLIKPTVGRKVWYRPSASDLLGPIPMSIQGSQLLGTDQPLDATVLAVWGDRLVTIEVKDIVGRTFIKSSCTLLQQGDPAPLNGDGRSAGGYAEWMPYQLGQAAKSENSQLDANPATLPGSDVDGVSLELLPCDEKGTAPIQHTEDPDHGDAEEAVPAVAA